MKGGGLIMRIKTILGLTVLVIAWTFTASCYMPETNISVRGFSDPDDTCAYTTSTSNTDAFRTLGTLDLMYLSSKVYQLKYVAGVQVFNWLVNTINTSSESQEGVIGNLYYNVNDAFPKGVRVKLSAPAEIGTGVAFGTYEWTLDVSGEDIPAATDSTTPGSGLILFQLIPFNVIANVIAMDPYAPLEPGKDVRVTIEMIIYFRTTSGWDIRSNTYKYMLTLCNGCLHPDANLDIAKMQCPAGYVMAGNLCSPGQDSATWCEEEE